MYQKNINSSMLQVIDEYPLLMPRWGYALSALTLFMIGFFGFFLNLMVILLMMKDRQLWTPLNTILFNLVCSDFSVSILGNPFTLTSALFHRWIFGDTMCVLYGFFMALLGITSITTLTVLAFERYMIVSRTLTSKNLTNRGARLCIVFIWTYSLALTLPPLLGWGNYVNEAANISCSVNWHEQSTNTLTYILYLFLMGQIIPMTVISYSYYNIVRTMKQNAQRLGRVSKAEAKVTTMVFVMILAFTFAWTPYSIFALLEQFGTPGIVSPGAGVIPALVAKSSICYNPLIYVGMNTQFRQSIKRVFGIRTSDTHLSATHKLSRVKDTTNTHDESKIYLDLNTNYESQKRNERRKEHAELDNNSFHVNLDNSNEAMLDDKSAKEAMYGDDIDSPVLNIISTNKLVYKKSSTNKDHLLINVYSNKAFEEITSETKNKDSVSIQFDEPSIIIENDQIID